MAAALRLVLGPNGALFRCSAVLQKGSCVLAKENRSGILYVSPRIFLQPGRRSALQNRVFSYLSRPKSTSFSCLFLTTAAAFGAAGLAMGTANALLTAFLGPVDIQSG